MYQVVLIDDDKLVTQFMEKMIPWEKCGFEVLATFQDSVKAYNFLKSNHYDVLITDIGMPHMNGIELISKLKVDGVRKYNVILTCHDEFHFAQKALKLNAYDYILKESMEEEYIIDLLKKLKSALDESIQKQYQEKVTSFLKKNNMSLKTKFIEEVINESFQKNEEWWHEQEELLNMNFSSKYISILCYIDQYQEATERFKSKALLQFSINNIVEEVLEKYQLNIQIFYLDNEFFVFFPLNDEKQMQRKLEIETLLKEVQNKLKEFLRLSITAVIDSGEKQGESLIQSIQTLIQNEEQRFYYSYGTLQYFETINYSKTSVFQNYIEELQLLRTFIMNYDKGQLKTYFYEKTNQIKDKRFSPKVVKDWAIKLVLDIKLSLKNLADFEGETFNAMTSRLLQETENIDEMEKTLIEICIQFMQHVNKVKEVSQNEDVVNAKRFVRSHLDKKISLKDVATYLHFNPSYFSRMFKKETGETFVEFVTRTKMEKAMELLDYTTKSVEQIAMVLGFTSKSYFVRTFKKHTGLAPIEYKYKKVQTGKQSQTN